MKKRSQGENRMNIDQLLSKHSRNYRFHGVRQATLEALAAQATDGKVALWGTDHDEHVDNQDGEFDAEYVQGAGFLYCTDIRDIDMSYQEFASDGLVLVLEKVAEQPFEFSHPTDHRQSIIKVEDWKVIGGLRPVFDEDEEVIDQEVVSLDEVLEM
jgi:hypothetical protein